jgi:hypothetical protein
MTKIYLQMEDGLNIFPNGRRPIFFVEMEEDINILKNEREPQSKFLEMEDNLNL